MDIRFGEPRQTLWIATAQRRYSQEGTYGAPGKDILLIKRPRHQTARFRTRFQISKAGLRFKAAAPAAVSKYCDFAKHGKHVPDFVKHHRSIRVNAHIKADSLRFRSLILFIVRFFRNPPSSSGCCQLAFLIL